LPRRYDLQLTSKRAIVNLMKLTLCHDIGDDRSFEGNIVLLDPYPEHIAQSLDCVGLSLVGLCKGNFLSSPAVETMSSIVFAGLSILEQVSYSARTILSSPRQLYDAEGFRKSHDIQRRPWQALSKAPSTTQSPPSSANNPDIFEAGLVQELGIQVDADPSLVNATIERCERSLDQQNFELSAMQDDAQWPNFDFLLQQWEFAVSQPL
jgi:hypothetical protein